MSNLYEHCTSERFVYRHRWSRHDVVIRHSQGDHGRDRHHHPPDRRGVLGEAEGRGVGTVVTLFDREDE